MMFMCRARVAWAGAVHEAVESDGQLLLTRSPYAGQRVSFDDVTWLPPLAPVAQPRTVLALGLNYADHAKELAFKAPEEPLGFLKAANTFIGHRAQTLRPADVAFMHYECELAVVIGKTASKVGRGQAYDYVAGYTVANDYALRDYLENWYRPNLRVKSRDTCTPLGPWLVDRDDVPDPMNLALSTTVNGTVTASVNANAATDAAKSATDAADKATDAANEATNAADAAGAAAASAAADAAAAGGE